MCEDLGGEGKIWRNLIEVGMRIHMMTHIKVFTLTSYHILLAKFGEIPMELCTLELIISFQQQLAHLASSWWESINQLHFINTRLNKDLTPNPLGRHHGVYHNAKPMTSQHQKIYLHLKDFSTTNVNHTWSNHWHYYPNAKIIVSYFTSNHRLVIEIDWWLIILEITTYATHILLSLQIPLFIVTPLPLQALWVFPWEGLNICVICKKKLSFLPSHMVTSMTSKLSSSGDCSFYA